KEIGMTMIMFVTQLNISLNSNKKGNWISKKRYSHIKTESGKLKKKKIKMVKTRKIKYRE
ncbi:hypothetical protein OAE07_04655, partial [Winogradskyella sp.]|nr:hypothetical protein [Winogradskyella sp.]